MSKYKVILLSEFPEIVISVSSWDVPVRLIEEGQFESHENDVFVAKFHTSC